MITKAAKTLQAEICIVGGGIVGTSFASRLAQSVYNSKRIVVIEAGDLFTQPDLSSIANRVSSLTPTSVQYLQELGAWDLVPQERKWGYHHMKVWDGCSEGEIEFDGSPVATIVENRLVQHALASTLKGLDSITVLNKERVKAIKTEGDRPVLELESGMKIDCEVVVCFSSCRLEQTVRILKLENMLKLKRWEWIILKVV
jgi:2-polyprenyl-6-methoxyphenol hydroxylase-like FAD-dependent oxidoreductase